MKKCIAAVLCVLCTLSAAAFAAESEPDYIAEYEALCGKQPVVDDYFSGEEFQTAYDSWLTGLEAYVNVRHGEWIRQKAEAAARMDAEEQTAPVETTPTKPTESAGLKNEISASSPTTSTDTGVPDKYPVGSRIGPAGNVYSPDGELLSPGAASAYAPASSPGEDDALLSGQLVDPDGVSPVSDVDTLAVIAGLVSDMAADEPVLMIEDLRPANPPAEVLTGMKALVTSIFGEYTPVTTTSVVTQTVGNDIHQYLVEAVAPGAAGVDYEWLSSVFLFGLLLFCLMKLLGGILK